MATQVHPLPCDAGPAPDENTLIRKCDALLTETEVHDLIRTARKCIDCGKHICLGKPAAADFDEHCRILQDAGDPRLIVRLGYKADAKAREKAPEQQTKTAVNNAGAV